ncbi:MAG: ABC transporter substrate-binding protein [Hyphomicrobiales bacterium]|nr:ABC transporter substrate-binding protein [Hyphomicrobiales bacterium]
MAQTHETPRPELQRREFLGIAGAAAASTAVLGAGSALASDNEEVARGGTIKLAGYGYDRVQAIMDGTEGMDGTDISFETSNIYAVSASAFGPEQKYDVTEIGLIPLIRKYVNEDFRAYTAIPVFISRIFRHRNVFVSTDSGIETPEDLRGKRVGTDGYAFSANTWIRGFLQDQHGVKPDDMHWIETSQSSDGAKTSLELNRHFLPDDFPLVKGPEGVDESDLLLSGECDAIIAAITPKAFAEGNPKIRRLFRDVRAAEQDYYRQTRVFPIMHTVAIRTELIAENPWLPKAVFDLYSKAKQVAYANLESTTVLRTTLPWATQDFEDTRALMGENFWPYGIEDNRKELELAMRYCHEQGLAKRHLDLEKLFHPSTLNLVENV